MVLDDPMILRLGCALVHFMWQGALIAGILAVLLAMLRRKSPNVKYAVCWVALSGIALCVPVTVWLIGEMSVIQAEAERVSEATESCTDVKLHAAISESPSDSAVPVAEPVLGSVQAPAEPFDYASEVSMDRRHWKVSALPWVVAVWLIGTIGLTLWRLGGWLCLRRYCRLGVHPASENVLRSCDSLLKRFPVGRSVEFLESTLVRVPMVVGWLRPVILLPVAVIAELTPQQLEMILAHELAHIRRWDYLWNLIQTAIETLLFYHPAVWWVSRRIRVERECCCDELAAGATGDRLVYARTLARLEELRQRQAPCHGPSLQVAASDGSLLSRIRRVLGRPHEDSRACYGWSGACVAMSVLLALIVTYVSTERIAAEGASLQTVHGDEDQKIVEMAEETLPQSEESNGLELALAIEDPAASPQRSEQGHDGASEVDSGRLLLFTFRNVGDTPFLLNTFLLATHLSFEISGPHGESVTESWRPVTGWSELLGESLPRALLPGQTWETTCPLHSVFRYESNGLLMSGPFRLRAVYRGEHYPFNPPEQAESDAIDQYVRHLFQSVPVQPSDALHGKFVLPESDETRLRDYLIEHGNIPSEIRRILLDPETNKPQHTPEFPSTPVPVPWSQQGCWEGTIRSNPIRFSLTNDELSILKAPIIEAFRAVVLPPDDGATVNTERHAQAANVQKFAGIVTDQPQDIVARWSDLKGNQTAEHPNAQGGNITFESQTPVFLHIKAIQKRGPDAPIKTVLDQWSDKPSTKYDIEVKSWKAEQPGGGFVYGDNRVYRKVAINYLRYDRKTTIESGVKSTTIHDTGAGCRMNAWIPSETGNHTENMAAQATRRMQLEVGGEATLYELCDPQTPDDIFFRLTICLAQSRPPAARTGVVTDDTGKPLENAGDSDLQRAARAAPIAEGDREDAPSPTTAQLQLPIAKGRSKSVTVALGQTAREIVDLCKPARVYADDDPWLAYSAAGGGSYLLLFAAEGTAEDMRGTPDPRHDTLYAVVHYPTESKSDGRFLLPETLRERTCGDFVTLKVPIAPNEVRVATVVLGMSDMDVMQLFQPVLDHAEEDHAITFDAIDRDARYLLILSGQGAAGTLSEVVYWPGEDAEPVYLLPRSKRGARVRDEYRATDGKTMRGGFQDASDNPNSGQKRHSRVARIQVC